MPVEETYRDETVELDGRDFVGCTFESCELVYRGGEVPRRVEGNTFRDCRWRFEDAAGRTVKFMAALYRGLDELGEEIVERTFDSIREGGSPLALLLAAVTAAAAAGAPPARAGGAPGPGIRAPLAELRYPATTAACPVAPHRVELEATGRAPSASGFATLRFAATPFGVAVTEEGTYRYRVEVQVRSVPPSADGTLVAWAATPELDRFVRLGEVGEDGGARGEVVWNKFLLFVTAERTAEPERWSGPVLLTGTSPSGNMHTMAGHGIYQQHGIGC